MLQLRNLLETEYVGNSNGETQYVNRDNGETRYVGHSSSPSQFDEAITCRQKEVTPEMFKK